MKKKKNYLDFVPVCAPGYSWKLNEKKLVEIEVQNKGFYNWLAQKFFKRPKVSYISLDEYGSFVWRQMDGQRTIYDIQLSGKGTLRRRGGAASSAPYKVFPDSVSESLYRIQYSAGEKETSIEIRKY